MGVIYMVRNKINNKVHFGQTIYTFDKRYANNFPKNYTNDHIKSSIEKYGWENFEVVKEFDKADTIDELNALEELYIKIWNTTNPDYGYNKQMGGRNGKPTAEVRKKMSDSKKEYFENGGEVWNKGLTYEASPEAKERARKRWEENEDLRKSFDRTGTKLKPHHIEAIKKANTGKIVTDETRKKLSKVQFDENGKAKGNKRVKCLDNGVVYDSVKIASQTLGINSSGIAKCCRGEQSQTNGYHFCFVDEETPMFVPKEEHKQVYCFETDKVYDHYAHASIELGVSPHDIRACCVGVTNQAGSYNVCHVEDKDKKQVKKIFCVTNGKTYNTAKEASIDLGVSPTTITHCCKGRYKQTKGYVFMYIEKEGDSNGNCLANVS